MKSVREMTKAAGTNRQAVYRYLKRNKIKTDTFDSSGKRIYPDDVAKKVVNNLRKRKTSHVNDSKEKLLKEQLKSKDDEIKFLRESLEKARNDFSVQQRLTAQAQQIALDRKNMLIEADKRQSELKQTQEQLKLESQKQKNEIQKAKDLQMEKEKKLKEVQDNLDATKREMASMKHASLWQRIMNKW